MNENINSGKWKEIKGEILKNWGKLTEDEVDRAEGNVMSLAGVIQQKFGLAQEEAATKLNKILEKFKDNLSSSNDSSRL
jgi:uncharacterized protein YjbJ (UPF0337 family)